MRWYKLNPKRWFTSIRWFIQRGRRGYADCDWWDLKSHLCSIIVPNLRRMAKEGNGCPSEFWETKTNNECWKWEEILEQMAQAFEIAEDPDNHLYTRWTEMSGGYDDRASGNLRKEIDFEALENNRRKMIRGLELFAKYFENLWD